ncbi:MAG: dTMP kinase [Dehalococcoidia bacterium]
MADDLRATGATGTLSRWQAGSSSLKAARLQASPLRRRSPGGCAPAGITVVHTREPGGTRAGELVRGLLHEELTPWAELFAFLVARAQLVEEVIRPALARGETVICDRFAEHLRLPGHARGGLDGEKVRAANSIATGGIEPDLVVYLIRPGGWPAPQARRNGGDPHGP